MLHQASEHAIQLKVLDCLPSPTFAPTLEKSLQLLTELEASYLYRFSTLVAQAQVRTLKQLLMPLTTGNSLKPAEQASTKFMNQVKIKQYPQPSGSSGFHTF